MASTPVAFYAPSGKSLTLELYPDGSDTIANGAGGDTATEETNRLGLYIATVTEALSGWYHAVVKNGSIIQADYWVKLADDTTTYYCGERSVGFQSNSNVAEQIFTTDMSNFDGSAPEHSLYTTVMAGLEFDATAVANSVVIYQTDGTTAHVTKTVTEDAAGNPIVKIE